jgi:FxsC-like protein
MAEGSDPHAGGFPLFFLSYAHSHWGDPAEQRDPDHWVRKFYGHLCTEIESLANIPPGQDPGFIDRRLRIGDLWPYELASRLSRCSVFVPLYSARYFRREDCGREWSVIRRRQDMHVSATSRFPNIVIPVLWQPVRLEDIPPWARDIQYSHESLGPAYHAHGLESMLRLRDQHDAYLSAVRTIAQRIVEVARRPDRLHPLSDVPRFQSLPNTFGTEEGPDQGSPRIRITVAALRKDGALPQGRTGDWYGETAQEWRPYRDDPRSEGCDTPVAWRAADVAQRRDFEVVVTELTGHSEELKPNRAAPSAPTVLLVDPWCTLDERWLTMLARLDTSLPRKPWIRVLFPWNNQDPETVGNASPLRAGIEAALGRCLASGRIPAGRGAPGPTDAMAFGPAVSDTIRMVQAAFLKNAEKHLPEGPRQRKPRLNGPSGDQPAPGGER